MAFICNHCGNTTHAPGARICAVCGAALPAGPTPAGGGALASSQPMLIAADGRRYRLNSNGETLIGSRGCAITLSDPNVAPKHARLSPTGRGFVIEDLSGSTQVNGAAIAGSTPLQPGDTVTVGRTNLVYQGGAVPIQAPRPHPPAIPRAPQPRPAAASPIQSPVPVVPSKYGILAEGEVRTVDPERQDQPPFDTGRLLVTLSVVLVMLGACAMVVVFSFAIWIALLIVGAGSIGCLLPMLLPYILSIFGPLLGSLRGRQTVPILNFQVFDLLSGMAVDVMLVRKQGSGGNVRLGDKVRVWGKRQADTGLIRGYKVEIYESGGHPTNFSLEGDKPVPIWLGLTVLGSTILGFIGLWVAIGAGG